KQKDFNKEESEGEKIEEMEGLSEEIYSELTGDAALTETGEQDGSEHVGDEVFAEADFDMEEDDQLMETETQECNRMFLFWTRHFAITMFIEIIKEHHLLQIVMKHLNWRNGYWLVLSCIKSRFSLVEYQVFFQGLMLLVSCGGIFIYMARSHTEHRALVSWPMGLSGG
ncbi:unnamed protein product, partial [Brassica rapa subsp. trilocularis]